MVPSFIESNEGAYGRILDDREALLIIKRLTENLGSA